MKKKNKNKENRPNISAKKIGIIYRPSAALISKYRHRPEKNPSVNLYLEYFQSSTDEVPMESVVLNFSPFCNPNPTSLFRHKSKYSIIFTCLRYNLSEY